MQSDGGWITGFRQVPSPNCDSRPQDEAVSLIVIHSISLPPGVFGGDAVERLFTSSLDLSEHPYYADLDGLKVSAHFFVRRTGEVLQFVPLQMRAWHAGLSSWRGRPRCNDFSIGIELEGTDIGIFTDAQYAELSRLISILRGRLPIQDIAAHSEVAPGRKSDPGPGFDWQRLHAVLSARDI
jgi:AmpD protein